jgi:hypothetical protein
VSEHKTIRQMEPSLKNMPLLAQISSNYGALCSVQQAARRIQPISDKARQCLESACELLREASREEFAQLSPSSGIRS